MKELVKRSAQQPSRPSTAPFFLTLEGPWKVVVTTSKLL